MSRCSYIIRQRRLSAIADLEERRAVLMGVGSDSPGTQSYEMNDGQIKVKAENANFKDVQAQLDKINAELDGLYLLVEGCAVGRMRTV